MRFLRSQNAARCYYKSHCVNWPLITPDPERRCIKRGLVQTDSYQTLLTLAAKLKFKPDKKISRPNSNIFVTPKLMSPRIDSVIIVKFS